jgi:hypothetical protein
MSPTKRIVLCLLGAAMLSVFAGSVTRAADTDRIRPYSGNPTYWQYRGKPVMLLGGSKTDHIFLLDDPEHYMFADISQVNSRNFDQTHWDRLQWLLRQVNRHPRPSNHTKIYGSGYYTFGTGGPEDGVERFWRNLLGGSASARFHRPDAGNGLNDLAKASIRAARILESQIKFWEIKPHMELLSDREPNEAYLAAAPGERYAVYFTNGGSVRLDLSNAPGHFNITWI